MRQSILVHAFTGRLRDEDSNRSPFGAWEATNTRGVAQVPGGS
jgi:hypothetical protein